MKFKKALKDTMNLSGTLPISIYCKKIWDQDKCWDSIEAYLNEYTDAQLSYGVCSNCVEKEMERFFYEKNIMMVAPYMAETSSYTKYVFFGIKV